MRQLYEVIAPVHPKVLRGKRESHELADGCCGPCDLERIRAQNM